MGISPENPIQNEPAEPISKDDTKRINGLGNVSDEIESFEYSLANPDTLPGGNDAKYIESLEQRLDTLKNEKNSICDFSIGKIKNLPNSKAILDLVKGEDISVMAKYDKQTEGLIANGVAATLMTSEEKQRYYDAQTRKNDFTSYLRDNFRIDQNVGQKIYEEIARRSEESSKNNEQPFLVEESQKLKMQRKEQETIDDDKLKQVREKIYGESNENSIENLKSQRNTFDTEKADIVLDALAHGIKNSTRFDMLLVQYFYGFLSGKGREKSNNEREVENKWKNDYEKFIVQKEKFLNKPGRPGPLKEKRSWLFFDTKNIQNREKSKEHKYRFYINPKSENVMQVFNNLIGELLKNKDISFQIKTYNMRNNENEKNENRCAAFDKIVMYSDEKSADKITELLSGYLENKKNLFGDKELPFSAKLKDKNKKDMNGIGVTSEIAKAEGEETRTTYTELQGEILSEAFHELRVRTEKGNEYFNKLKKAGYQDIANWLKKINIQINKSSKNFSATEVAKAILSSDENKNDFKKYFPDLYKIAASKKGIDIENIAFTKTK